MLHLDSSSPLPLATSESWHLLIFQTTFLYTWVLDHETLERLELRSELRRSYVAASRYRLAACQTNQDSQARPAQPCRDSSPLRTAYGRSNLDDLQDTLTILCGSQSFSSLTSPPTLHHSTPNIPTPATSPRHSHHSQMSGIPHTPPLRH